MTKTYPSCRHCGKPSSGYAYCSDECREHGRTYRRSGVRRHGLTAAEKRFARETVYGLTGGCWGANQSLTGLLRGVRRSWAAKRRRT